VTTTAAAGVSALLDGTAVAVADNPGRSIGQLVRHSLEAALTAFVLLVVIALRDYWLPIVRDVFAAWHCPSFRDNYCMGWLSSKLCPCCVNKFHEPFRLRIAVKRAWNLRRTDIFGNMEAFVLVQCGNNPLKSTAVQVVPLDNGYYPVEWNDTIDIEVQISDEFITLQVADFDQMSSSDVIGATSLCVSEFYDKMQGSLSDVGGKHSCGEISKPLVMRGEDAGELVVELFATKPGKPLPAVTPGVYDGSGAPVTSEQEPLLTTIMSAWGLSSGPKASGLSSSRA
jgi:hypothetical protein